jgi:hypothetical protein
MGNDRRDFHAETHLSTLATADHWQPGAFRFHGPGRWQRGTFDNRPERKICLSKPAASDDNWGQPKGPPMRYACLVYFDPKNVFNRSPEAEAALRETGAYNGQLSASGHMVSNEALQLPHTAMTIRVRDGKMSAVDGPFMETKEVLGGFLLIEARDLNEAVQVAAGIPLAKLGAVEVRPVVDFSQPRPEL